MGTATRPQMSTNRRRKSNMRKKEENEKDLETKEEDNKEEGEQEEEKPELTEEEKEAERKKAVLAKLQRGSMGPMMGMPMLGNVGSLRSSLKSVNRPKSEKVESPAPANEFDFKSALRK